MRSFSQVIASREVRAFCGEDDNPRTNRWYRNQALESIDGGSSERVAPRRPVQSELEDTVSVAADLHLSRLVSRPGTIFPLGTANATEYHPSAISKCHARKPAIANPGHW